MTTARAAVIAAMLLALLGCASDPHDNFKRIMTGQIGKDSYSPSALAARNPANLVGLKTLANGNIEEAYAKSQGECRHYFEIDRVTEKIMGWRYEGSRQACTIWP